MLTIIYLHPILMKKNLKEKEIVNKNYITNFSKKYKTITQKNAVLPIMPTYCA